MIVCRFINCFGKKFKIENPVIVSAANLWPCLKFSRRTFFYPVCQTWHILLICGLV